MATYQSDARRREVIDYLEGLLQSGAGTRAERAARREAMELLLHSPPGAPAHETMAKADSPQLRGLKDQWKELIGLVREAPSGSKLTSTELISYVSAHMSGNSDQDERLALSRVLGRLSANRDMALSGPALDKWLTGQSWMMSHNMSEAQQKVLTNVIGQLGEASSRPAMVRGYLQGKQNLSASRPTPRSGEPIATPLPDQGPSLLEQVSKAAEGSVVIDTSTTGGMELTYSFGRGPSYGGFRTFGDGVSEAGGKLPPHLAGTPSNRRAFRNSQGADVYPVEVWSCEPIIETVYGPGQQDEGWRGWLGRETKSKQVKVDERDVTTRGPDGQMEPAVQFGYAYNQRLAGDGQDRMNLPKYPDMDTDRPGNLLIVQAVLPKSVADKLAEEIARNPLVARQLAEKLVLERGGVSPVAWAEGAGDYGQRMKPPYEGLPDNHEIYRLNKGHDGEMYAEPAKAWKPQPQRDLKQQTQPGNRYEQSPTPSVNTGPKR